MALMEMVIGFIGLVLFTIIIFRYLEIIPQFLFRLFAWGKEFLFIHPSEYGILAELVEIPSERPSPRFGILFSSTESESGILMISNWFHPEDYQRNLKTGAFLQSLGFNVLMPFYHHLDAEQHKFEKLTFSPKTCQDVIQAAFEYMITRPEIDKRQIGIYSSGFGTYLASQLIRNQPIKAVVLEDGPVGILNYVAGHLQHSRGIPFRVTRLILALALWPVLWRTTWQKKDNFVRNLHACPTFMIAVREDQTFPNNEIWKNYNAMYMKCPNDLWWVHGIIAGSARDTWPDEYAWQLRSFYDHWLGGVPRPDFHFDFKVKRRKARKYPIEINITTMPPQMDEIPLQILLVDRSLKITKEIRIFFSGASMTVELHASFRPRAISVKQFSRVDRDRAEEANQLRLWSTQGAEEALKTSIKQLVDLPIDYGGLMLEQYWFLKGVLLNEQGQREEAVKAFDKLHSRYWKRF